MTRMLDALKRLSAESHQSPPQDPYIPVTPPASEASGSTSPPHPSPEAVSPGVSPPNHHPPPAGATSDLRSADALPQPAAVNLSDGPIDPSQDLPTEAVDEDCDPPRASAGLKPQWTVETKLGDAPDDNGNQLEDLLWDDPDQEPTSEVLELNSRVQSDAAQEEHRSQDPRSETIELSSPTESDVERSTHLTHDVLPATDIACDESSSVDGDQAVAQEPSAHTTASETLTRSAWHKRQPAEIQYVSLRETVLSHLDAEQGSVMIFLGVSDVPDRIEMVTSFARSLVGFKPGEVAVIDATHDASGVAERFHARRTPGLADVVQQRMSLSRIVFPTRTEGLVCLPLGNLTAIDETEFTSALSPLRTELCEQFQLVVIDGGNWDQPLSKPFARIADVIYLVAQTGMTRRHQAKKAVADIKKWGVRVAGCVLTGARQGMTKHE